MIATLRPQPRYLQPGAAVDDATPLPGFSYVIGVSKVADGIGVDAAAIVESDISVATRLRHATGAGPAERHRYHPRLPRDVFDDRGNAHSDPPTTTGNGSPHPLPLSQCAEERGDGGRRHPDSI